MLLFKFLSFQHSTLYFWDFIWSNYSGSYTYLSTKSLSILFAFCSLSISMSLSLILDFIFSTVFCHFLPSSHFNISSLPPLPYRTEINSFKKKKISVLLLSVLGGHSGVLSPHHNDQWPQTSKDFYPRFYPLNFCPILILERKNIIYSLISLVCLFVI